MLCFGNRGIHQHRITTDFHGDACVRRGTDTGIDDDRDAAVFYDGAKCVAVLNAETRACGHGKRHNSDAADRFEFLRNQRIVGRIDHHGKAILTDRLSSPHNRCGIPYRSRVRE